MNKHHQQIEFDKVLNILSSYSTSALAKEKCRNLDIFDDIKKIEYELTLVDEAKKLIDDNPNQKPILVDIKDIKEIFKNHNFDAFELHNLATILKISREIRTFILKFDYAQNLNKIADNFYLNKELEDEIFSSFDKELNLKDDVTPTLKALNMSLKDNKEILKNEINNLLNDSHFSCHLQENIVTTRNNRPVFQIKASSKNKVQGIVHDVSNTNLTYFIEPNKLIPLNNKIRKIELDIQNEILRILAQFSEKFRLIKDDLIKDQKILTRLDIIFAKAKYSIFSHSTSAQLNNDKIIDIQAMRHPLLINKGIDIVENDFILGKDFNCLLITGSNTGGKTVCLKTVGLMVLMTKAAMHIPALGANIYPYKNIFCDISTEQNLELGLSTFCAHMKNISDIIDSANEDSLILLDELGSGTDPNEASKLSWAILENLRERNIQSIVTTHLSELKNLKFVDNYFENATVLFDNITLKPKYKLIYGLSGSSNAIDISKTIGLNENIIKRAKELYKNEQSEELKIVNKIEKTNLNLIQKQNDTQIALDEAKKFKDEYDKKLEELNKQKKKSLQNFKKKFQSELENARDEIKQTVDEIRKEKTIKIALRSYNRLNRIENAIRQEFSKNDDELSQKYQNLDINNLKIGQNVLIKRLNQVVILDSLPDKKGFVTVRIGNIKSKVKLNDLAYTDKKVQNHLKKVSVNFDYEDNLLSRLDVRGMRADEAIDYVDKKLDSANLRGLNQITIIHGLGTGALKKAIANYLETSPYVAKFRYGNMDEGSEGVVIVDLV